jgi:SSS family solute:Na+ symporter
MLVTLWFIGLIAPIMAFGGYQNMFNILSSYEASKPIQHGFHLAPTINDLYFLYSIILVAPLAFWLWPNRIQNIFGARDPGTVRKNMVLVGIYQLGQIPAILVGLTAVGLFATGILHDPLYVKETADKSFMLVVRLLFNPWVVGIVGSAALAASLSTAAAIIHVSGALFARNVISAERGRLLLFAQLFTAFIAFTSLYLAIYMPGILIYLLLVGYAGIAQFFPEYIIALKKPGLIGWKLAVVARLLE